MKESVLASKVRAWVVKRGAFYRRIENLVGEGDPDTYICIRGRHVWIELKTGTALRTSQINWMHLAHRSGVPFLAMKMKDNKKVVLFNQNELIGEYDNLDLAMNYVWETWLS